MAINTNHPTESLTTDSGVLSINTTGALKLPSGVEVERPEITKSGFIRFSEDSGNPEYFDGTEWKTVADTGTLEQQITNIDSSINQAISELSLNDLTDVLVSSPSTGQVLTYDTVLGQFRSQTQSLAPITRTFFADGATLEFDIVTSVSSVNNLVVSINGIQQEPFYSYTLIDGHIVLFDEPPAENDRLQVRILQTTNTTDRPRPKITSISYSAISNYTAISIVASDVTYGTGAKLNDVAVTRIDYPYENTLQLMVETANLINSSYDLTLVDTSGNEFKFPNLIKIGVNVPYWTNSESYIGTFSGGGSISYDLGVANATSIVIEPSYEGEQSIPWLTVNNITLTGTAPQNSSPSRYEVKVTASNGIVNITKNYWLLVI
jgi:hypothetical protein